MAQRPSSNPRSYVCNLGPDTSRLRALGSLQGHVEAPGTPKVPSEMKPRVQQSQGTNYISVDKEF